MKFTIVTCTYNAAKTLSPTLDSVRSQDFPAIEHLFVDGLSSDATLRMIQAYAEAVEREQGLHTVRFVSEPDEGLYDAMNKAIAMAGGDYILFLNAGDKLHAPDTLSRVAATITANGDEWPAVVYGHTDIVDAEGHFVRHRRLQPPLRLSWRNFQWGMLVCHQAFFVRGDVAKQNPYQLSYRFSADYDWCIRVLKQAERQQLPVVNAQVIVADYLNEGLTTQHHRKSLLERFRIMQKHYGLVKAVCLHLLFIVRAVVKR